MDYKEKYEMALEGIQEILSSGEDSIKMSRLQMRLQGIFPELKESEDERIRKRLIAMCQHYIECYALDQYNIDGYKEALAWLEKQRDKDKLIQELGEYKVKYTQEVLEKHINSMSNKDDERLRKTAIAFLKDFAEQGYENAVECIDWLEKQGEQKSIDNLTPQDAMDIAVAKCFEQGKQKSADNVEPKFKVGDWVTDGDKTTQIVAVGTGLYIINRKDMSEVSLSTEYIEKWYHLWTIQDAKNGDILSNEENSIVIFRGIGNKRWNDVIDYHIGLFTNSQHLVVQTNLSHWGTINEVTLHPATKKQRDILFKAMADAGYTFDFEKKELKKIKQQQEWSEEDESMHTRCIGILGKCYMGELPTKVEEELNWLKSLKERYTWKPSKEQIIALRWVFK
jgi:hypothetical protein